jgi:predicted ferric reductase
MSILFRLFCFIEIVASFGMIHFGAIIYKSWVDDPAISLIAISFIIIGVLSGITFATLAIKDFR